MLSYGTSIQQNTTQSTTDTYTYLNDFQGNYAESESQLYNILGMIILEKRKAD